jgi:hypothetical protein
MGKLELEWIPDTFGGNGMSATIGLIAYRAHPASRHPADGSLARFGARSARWRTRWRWVTLGRTTTIVEAMELCENHYRQRKRTRDRRLSAANS